MNTKTIGILVVLLLAVGLFLYFGTNQESKEVKNTEDNTQEETKNTTTKEITGTSTMSDGGNMEQKEKTILGSSVEGRDIVAYHYGTGEKEIIFVGGLHGGYSWNTTLLAYDLMEYLKEHTIVPENVTVTVIPVVNPDGLFATVGKTERFTKADVSSDESVRINGRFNANDVDLNRNFDCDWQENATWQKRSVSGGSSVFSEPESQAIQAYIEAHTPTAVVVYYSAVGGVFASSCHNGVADETSMLTNLYADASGYKAYDEFDFYDTTGDMVNWLAKNNIPAISVLLTTHEDVEWERNEKGIDAVLSRYGE